MKPLLLLWAALTGATTLTPLTPHLHATPPSQAQHLVRRAETYCPNSMECEDGCIPYGGDCCNDGEGGYCPVGSICWGDGCCPVGKRCEGSMNDGSSPDEDPVTPDDTAGTPDGTPDSTPSPVDPAPTAGEEGEQEPTPTGPVICKFPYQICDTECINVAFNCCGRGDGSYCMGGYCCDNVAGECRMGLTNPCPAEESSSSDSDSNADDEDAAPTTGGEASDSNDGGSGEGDNAGGDGGDNMATDASGSTTAGAGGSAETSTTNEDLFFPDSAGAGPHMALAAGIVALVAGLL